MIHYFQVSYEEEGDFMEFNEMKENMLNQLLSKQLIQATVSQPRTKSNEIKRIKLKPIEIKNMYHIQLEYQYERILKHENILLEDFTSAWDKLLDDYRQIHMDLIEENIQIQLSKKNKVMYKSERTTSIKQVDQASC